MRERYIKTQHGEFETATYDGQSVPIKPWGDNVLILTDRFKEMTKGGIIITDTQADIMNVGAESGVIVAMGRDAFRWNLNRTQEYDADERPKVGDRVCFTRYSGQVVFREGAMFRLMTDNCVGGLEVEELSDEQTKALDDAIDKATGQSGMCSPKTG